jgi:hypothetical protein
LARATRAAKAGVSKWLLEIRETDAKWWLAGDRSFDHETGDRSPDTHPTTAEDIEENRVYGLPKDFTGTFLKDRRLEMICFNANQVYFHFDGGVSIAVESSFAHQTSRSESNAKVLKVPVSVSSLMQLLEHSVIEVSGDEKGTLSLSFDHGHILKLFDSSPQYESYHIKRGDEMITV